MSINHYGGLDFGTSGVRISIINSNKDVICSKSIPYKGKFINPMSWIEALEELFLYIPIEIKDNLLRLSISGTSGTLLACSSKGKCMGYALPYNQKYEEDLQVLEDIAGNNKFLNNPFSSLAKAIQLIDMYGREILLRHQSDWITGWLTNNWQYGEESNNLKLGWDQVSSSWPNNFDSFLWKKCLPEIKKSGEIIGKINNVLAKRLGLNKDLLIIAGTTDSNAAFLAAQIKEEEGLTILGTTIVLKKKIKRPVKLAGITNYRINEEWICGGASNAGCGILSKYFSDIEIEELSKQINPNKEANLDLLPLNCVGERFPINDPFLKPKLEPRPVSDALFLQGLFEGLALIELNGWEKMKAITGNLPKKIVTIGGGSKNPQWRAIRERIINIPIKSTLRTPSYGAALIAYSSSI